MSVSVIIRAYNAEKYIEEAILSVINQTYEGVIEIIVCFDEGSKTRQALEIVEQLKAKYQSKKRIFKIISHSHMSPFRALLFGLNVAEGDYIAFLDYDNVYDKNFIQNLVTSIKKGKADIAFGTTVFTDANLNPINILNPPTKVKLKDLLILNFIDMSSLMISREAIKTIVDRLNSLSHRYFDWIFEDYLIALISVKEALNIIHVNDAKYFYRIHEFNISASAKIDDITYIMNKDRELKTFIAFHHIYRGKLDLSERINIFTAILKTFIVILLRGLRLSLLMLILSCNITFLNIIRVKFKKKEIIKNV
ncbi:MAG: glycosyltransferase [Candidatus Bathyarchaeia archaeon]